MLAEFFLVPEVFAGSDDELRTRVNELREVLLPRHGVSTFTICQLGSKEWQTAVTKRIASIRNPEIRSNAQVLFERIITYASVSRPLPATQSLESNNDWIFAAEQSSKLIALDGIVISTSSPDVGNILSAEQFTSDECCDRFPNPRFVARTELAQMASLRTICLHSDWLILRLPQIRGGVDDEIVTLKQVLKLASRKLPGQAKSSVELHICKQEKIPDIRLKNSIDDELSVFRNNFAEVDVRFFPKKTFTDRQIFGGEWAWMPSGQRSRRVRWLVTMSHVAIGNSHESSTEPCTWSLFDRKAAHARLKQIEKSLLPNRV